MLTITLWLDAITYLLLHIANQVIFNFVNNVLGYWDSLSLFPQEESKKKSFRMVQVFVNIFYQYAINHGNCLCGWNGVWETDGLDKQCLDWNIKMGRACLHKQTKGHKISIELSS